MIVQQTVQHQHVVTRSGQTGDHTYDNPAYRETKFSLLIHRTDNPMYIPTTEDNKDSISEDPIYEHIVIGPRDHFNFIKTKITDSRPENFPYVYHFIYYCT